MRDILETLMNDGWYIDTIQGSHRQLKHPTKPGKVTVNGKLSDDLGDFLIKSIERQAGVKL